MLTARMATGWGWAAPFEYSWAVKSFSRPLFFSIENTTEAMYRVVHKRFHRPRLVDLRDDALSDALTHLSHARPTGDKVIFVLYGESLIKIQGGGMNITGVA